jgi:hypothetical protein
MKVCSKCKKTKFLSDFYNDSRYKDGKTCYCKECQNKSAKKSLNKIDPREELIKEGEENIRKIIQRYGH